MTGLTHATGINLVADASAGISARAPRSARCATRRPAPRRSARRPESAWATAWTRCSSRAASSIAETTRAARSDVQHARTTWLFRNNFKFQLTPSWRLLGKLNHSDSESSLGQFYDGGYTEAVVGYAYPSGAQRPAERPDQVHVLLQRADDGPGDAQNTRPPSSSRRATSRRWI